MSWKGDVGTSLIKQRKETSPMRNQRNDEGRICVTALFIQKSECEVTPGNKVQMQEGVGWFGSMAALSDRSATWLSHTPGRPRCWARGMRDNVARPFLRTLAPMLAVLWHNADLWIQAQLTSPDLVLHFYFCLRTSAVGCRTAVAEVPGLLAPFCESPWTAVVSSLFIFQCWSNFSWW